MRKTIGLCCVLTLAGCADGEKLTVKTVTAKDVPIHFAYGSIKDGDARYSGAESSWSGYTVRRASYRAGDEFATFDLMRSIGNWVFPRRSTSTYVGDLLKKDTKVAWGGTGELLGTARPTEYQTFLLPAAKATCVGLQRGLADHPDSAGNLPQLLLIGFYCRAGTDPIAPEEARRIAGAVHA